MDNKQERKWGKEFYQALKIATKKRKIKLSAEQDIYKKKDEYFYNVFYYIGKIENGIVNINLNIEVKYHRFDELQNSIVCPENPLHFTDKIRANSSAKCSSVIAKITQPFDFGDTQESLSRIAEELLDFLKKYIDDFLEMVNQKYGDLDGYYIANKDANPRLAGLAYLDKGNIEGAIECFSKMGESSLIWSVDIHTDEQRRRVKENGYEIYTLYGEHFHRNEGEQFVDYAVALENNLEWTKDRAMYGLLNEERKKK